MAVILLILNILALLPLLYAIGSLYFFDYHIMYITSMSTIVNICLGIGLLSAPIAIYIDKAEQKRIAEEKAEEARQKQMGRKF